MKDEAVNEPTTAPMRKEFSRRTKADGYERSRIEGVPCCEGIVCERCGGVISQGFGHPISNSGRNPIICFHGHGHRCGNPLRPGRFVYDHRIPCELGGDNSLGNLQVLGECCDKPKTAKDQKDIAKSRRIRDKGSGALKTRRPMMGSKASGWKKKMNGTVVRR